MLDQSILIISIIAPIFLIALIGYFYAHVEKPDMQVINRMILQLLVPALIFSIMSRQDFQMAIYARLALGATCIVLITGIVGFFAAKQFNFKWTTLVPPMMFRNWGNLGIPLIVFAFGEESLNAAVILFVVGATLHYTLGIALMSDGFEFNAFIRNPVIIAVLLGLIVNIGGFTVPNAILKPLDLLGQSAVPLMLFSLGVRIHHVHWSDMKIAFVAAALMPLVGLLTAFGVGSLLELSELQLKQLLVFGALPPAVMNYMFAEQYSLEPEKVASIVLLCNLLSIGTYFILLYFIV